MRLVFYSGYDESDNLSLNLSLKEMIGQNNPLVTFISCGSDGDTEFSYFVDQFKLFGWKKFLYCSVDNPIDTVFRKKIFEGQIIHLDGGNTFYFLQALRNNDMLESLKLFVERGGILTGLSAGAIIMTPNITMASIPSFDRDENYVGLTRLSSMNLVHFEFFPHYKQSKRYDDALKNYSKKMGRVIYACPDGSGIVINHEKVTFNGKCWGFYQGKKMEVYKRGPLLKAPVYSP